MTKKEYQKQWYKNNRERVLKRQKQYRKSNLKKRAKYEKQYYLKNQEKIKEYNKQRSQKKRDWIVDYKLSRGCSVCGYNKCASALEFHHNGDKEFNIGNHMKLSLENIKIEVKKCIIICANCHRELHEKKRGQK